MRNAAWFWAPCLCLCCSKNASAFWPYHKFCFFFFFSHPVSVAASCLTRLCCERVRGSPRCCSDRVPHIAWSCSKISACYKRVCLLQMLRVGCQIQDVTSCSNCHLRLHILTVKAGALSFSESQSKNKLSRPVQSPRSVPAEQDLGGFHKSKHTRRLRPEDFSHTALAPLGRTFHGW